MKTLKNRLTLTIAASALALNALIFAAPAGAAPLADANPAPAAGILYQVPSGDLSPSELADLIFMREEEKLARDVYLTLFAEWNFQVFSNIAGSEQAHMDAMLILLDRYGIADPVGDNEIGQFSDPELQALYDQLVDEGSQSLAAALKVGAAIEEIDIPDLVESIANTDHADIQAAYENLLAGSENHLRAFVRTLERQTGETYEPQYMDQAAFDEIMAGAAGNGRDRGRGGRP